MQPVDPGTPGPDDIVVKLRRLGRHFSVLGGLGGGPSFEVAAATCNAGADEVERLRAENGSWSERHEAALVDLAAMHRTRLHEGADAMPPDALPDDHRLGPRH